MQSSRSNLARATIASLATLASPARLSRGAAPVDQIDVVNPVTNPVPTAVVNPAVAATAFALPQPKTAAGRRCAAFPTAGPLYIPLGKESATMSTSPQQPPLRPGDRVRYIHDQGHLEVVESCEFAGEALIPHWQVVTTWDGNRRIADAAEFVIERAP